VASIVRAVILYIQYASSTTSEVKVTVTITALKWRIHGWSYNIHTSW